MNDHCGGRGRPVQVYTLLDAGNGNTNSEIPEKTAFVLPLPRVDEGKTKPAAPIGLTAKLRQAGIRTR